MLTVMQAVEQYLGHLKARNLAKASIQLYGDALTHLAEVLRTRGRRSMARVVPQDLDVWLIALNRQGLSSGVRRNRAFLIRRFFKWLHLRGEMLSNPAKDLPVPKKADPLPKVPPDADDMETLLDDIQPATPLEFRNKALLEILYGTMLRIRETVDLDLKDVNLDDRVLAVRFGKGQKDRMLPLPRRTQEAVVAYLDVRSEVPTKTIRPGDRHALLLSRRGRRLSREAARDVVRDAGEAIGSHLHPHLLRHAGALHMLRSGQCDVRHLQELLGHDDLETTAGTYLRLVPADLKEAYDKAFPILKL